MDQNQHLENSDNDEQQAIQEEIKAQAKNRYYNADFWGAPGAFFKNIVNFKGRSSRREFWWSMLYLMILVLIAWFVIRPSIIILFSPNFMSLAVNLDDLVWISLKTDIVYFILALPFFIGQFSLFLRRLRDVGHGKWLIWIYIPLFVLMEILSLKLSYQQAEAGVLIIPRIGSDYATLRTLEAQFEIAMYLTAFVSLVMIIIASFPNKPFSIGDDRYNSNGQRITV